MSVKVETYETRNDAMYKIGQDEDLYAKQIFMAADINADDDGHVWAISDSSGHIFLENERK